MTIVQIGKVIMQEAKGEGSRYWQVLEQEVGRIVRQVVGACLEAMLTKEVDRQLARKRHQRRAKMWGEMKSEMKCKRCGSQQRNQFRRNGSYARGLDTGYGHVVFRMPQVECKCGGGVRVKYPMLKARQRIWEDVRLEIREKSGLKLPLRVIKAELDARLGGSVGLRSINQCICATAPGATIYERMGNIATPPVILVDGVWVTVMYPTGEKRMDRISRQRQVKRGQRRVVLMAQGVWPESGKREMLGWKIAESEDQDAWSDLVAVIRQRGVRWEQVQLLIGDGSPGFEALRLHSFPDLPFQRCVFHKLQNISRDLVAPQHLSREQAHTYKHDILHQAQAIWQASSFSLAQQRLHDFCARFQSEQPTAVQTLLRDVELTFTFYHVQAQAAERGQNWPFHFLRTSSHLERENRETRSLFRHRLLFQSLQGLTAALFLQTLIRSSTSLAVPDLFPFSRSLGDFLDTAAKFLT